MSECKEWGTCEDCRHYRLALRENAPAVTLSMLVESGDPEVYQELKQIAVEESDHFKNESDRILSYQEEAIRVLDECGYRFMEPPGSSEEQPDFSDEQKAEFNLNVKRRLAYTFPRQPMAVTHCAEDTAHGRFYVAEIRNWAKTCEKFSKRSALPVCSACAFYQTSSTEKQKHAEADALIGMIGTSHSDASAGLRQRASELMSGIGPGKAHDLRIAAAAEGRLQQKLSYLPYCEAPCPQCCTLTKPSPNCRGCKTFCVNDVFRKDKENGHGRKEQIGCSVG